MQETRDLRAPFAPIDGTIPAELRALPTPCYVVDEGKIRKNLEILADLEQECGCHILLAQKAFSMYSLYPMIGQYISGTTASGLYEARLGYEEMGKENHVFAPAYKEKDMKELVQICDHIIFYTFAYTVFNIYFIYLCI